MLNKWAISPGSRESSTLEDICYRVGILKRVLIEERTLLNPTKDPLEACLLQTLEDEVEGCPRSEKDICAKLLNSTPTYIRNRKHKKGLFLEDRSLKNDKQCAPEVAFMPLPLHLSYEFLSPNEIFLVIISLIMPKPRNCYVFYKSIRTTMGIALTISRE